MSKPLSITLNIGGRSYPLTIAPEEEENLRKAAKMINDNIADLEGRYAVRDKQDVLAMTALQYANLVLDGQRGTIQDDSVLEQLTALSSKLNQYLGA